MKEKDILKRAGSLTFAILLMTGTGWPALAQSDEIESHYSPAENLEHIDVGLIDSAEHEIDFAAYALTDWPVIEAFPRAADRGVEIKIYLDNSQLKKPSQPFQDLAETPTVSIRIKRESAFMQLKSYEIDRRLLRTGSANFSASGLKRQDNDLIIVRDAKAVEAFKRDFESTFEHGAILALP